MAESEGWMLEAWVLRLLPGTLVPTLGQCLQVKRSQQRSLQGVQRSLGVHLGCILPLFLHKNQCHTRVEHFNREVLITFRNTAGRMC